MSAEIIIPKNRWLRCLESFESHLIQTWFWTLASPSLGLQNWRCTDEYLRIRDRELLSQYGARITQRSYGYKGHQITFPSESEKMRFLLEWG